MSGQESSDKHPQPSGIRYPLTSALSLTAGTFQVTKPYFNLDANNVDRLLAPATLRMQVRNLFDVNPWSIGLTPGLSQFPPRTLVAYLTVDI